MTESDAHSAFLAANYVFNRTEAKVNEYISPTGRIAYLRLGQGFPKHADVVIHPSTEADPFLLIPGVQPNPRVEFRHGRAMSAFPKRLNDGENPLPYGRALQAVSVDALQKLCELYDRTV